MTFGRRCYPLFPLQVPALACAMMMMKLFCLIDSCSILSLVFEWLKEGRGIIMKWYHDRRKRVLVLVFHGLSLAD